MSRIEDALQEALVAVAAGSPAGAALAAYPDLGEELRPLLDLAARTASLSPEPPTAALGRSRARLLAALAAPEPVSRKPRSVWRAPRFALAGLAVVLILCATSIGLSNAAADSLPGDLLFGAKLAAQDLRLRLATRPETRFALASLYSQQRVDEIRRLLLLKRVAPVAFDGPVESVSPDVWTVDGILVRLDVDTQVGDGIVPGTVVHVTGLTQPDGTLLAHEIRLRAYDLVGVIDTLDARRLVLDGIALSVTADTSIDSGAIPGALVRVHVEVGDEGDLRAGRVTLLALPTPTPSPAPPTSLPPTKEIEPTEDREAPEEGEATRVEGEDHGEEVQATPEPEPSETHEGDNDDDGEAFQPKKVDFEGVVQSISGSTWVVSGKVLSVTGSTEIRDDPGVGDPVKVVAFTQEDGSLWASRIERED